MATKPSESGSSEQTPATPSGEGKNNTPTTREAGLRATLPPGGEDFSTQKPKDGSGS